VVVPNRLELNKNANGNSSKASKTMISTDMKTALFAGKYLSLLKFSIYNRP
jgi:hypothetical protein